MCFELSYRSLLTIPKTSYNQIKKSIERAIWLLRRQFNVDIAKHIVFYAVYLEKVRECHPFFRKRGITAIFISTRGFSGFITISRVH